MFSSRRPGKRSIVGSRVCAPYINGFYWPAVITSIESTGPWVNAGDRYTVEFQDGTKKTFEGTQIIGAGFQPLTKECLQSGQTVYITHNGREMKGVIADIDGDEVGVSLGDIGHLVQVKADDVRLIESRRSARLSECQHDSSSESIYVMESGKRRTSDDTPSRRKAHCHSEQLNGEDLNSYRHCNDVLTMPNGDMDMEQTMDERIAALVLTSLSCSPSSPALPPGFDCQDFGSSTSSGVWTMKSSSSSSPSPPKSGLSQSAPVTSFVYANHTSDEDDEDDDDDDDEMCIDIDSSSMFTNKRTLYKCTWPGCSSVFDNCSTVENHIRLQHLRNSCKTSTTCDHEEEFYYTEVEPSSDSVMSLEETRQKQQQLVALTAMDHDYQRKEHTSKPVSIPKSISLHATNVSSPLAIPFKSQDKDASPWQTTGQWNSFTFESSSHTNSHSDVPQSVVSPNSKTCRKSRGADIRKCRKVYGIENRSLWCTQCKWKKACTRFFDVHY